MKMRTDLWLIKRTLILGFALVLTACATVPAPEAPKNETLSWDNRVQTLESLSRWDIKALIAIRNNREAESASLDWQQNNQNFIIHLFGPLGTNAYTLVGKSGKVQLATPEGKQFSAESPEALLAKQTGWILPVSHLKYWIRGLPVPGVESNKTFDRFHHLTELDQEGWHVQFLRYTAAHHIDLPSKIFISNPELTVKIIISQWQPHLNLQ